MTFQEIFAQYPFLTHVVAGGAGGLVRSISLRENWREGLANITVGGICAVYLGPVAMDMAVRFTGGPLTGATESLGPFLVGVFGMGLTGFLIDAVKFARQKQAEAHDGS